MRYTLIGIALVLAGCGNSGGEDPAAFQQRIEEVAQEPLVAAPSPEERALDQALFDIAAPFDGYLGIAVHDIARDRTVHFNGNEHLPQQSLSKLWVTLAALRMVDAGELDLSERVSIRRSDLTLFHQPVRQIVLARGGFNTTYGDLMRRAITESDNTANDMLLKRVGGPAGVRNAIGEARLGAIRFGPGEVPMQSKIAGVEWDPSYSIGNAFFDARKRVPASAREAAFTGYVLDPVDGATPRAIALALARLARGELLEPGTTALFLQLLKDVKSGPNRLKGGVPPGWSIGHKTGTGQVLDSAPPAEQAGYNDVGILTAPDGARYSVVVMIGRTAVPLPVRMELMHKVVEAIVRYHHEAGGEAIPDALRPEPVLEEL
ncbi:serine hydrolase [Erythrobacter litoralis]|nr:serine hydrolase [Erythrobacter litoralis]